MRSTLAFLLGTLFYLPYHYMASLLGSLTWPVFVQDFLRAYRKPAAILADLALIGLPMALLFAALSILVFITLLRPTLRSALFLALGWSIPAAVVLLYGYQFQLLNLLAEYQKWPHLVLVQAAPLLGIAAASWLAQRTNRRQALSAA